jgi:hypothetical protein
MCYVKYDLFFIVGFMLRDPMLSDRRFFFARYKILKKCIANLTHFIQEYSAMEVWSY